MALNFRWRNPWVLLLCRPPLQSRYARNRVASFANEGVRVAYRVLTINREFGSGGGRIAQTIANWLGWKLLDRNIIDAIAYSAHVDADVVQHYDEHVDSWLRRLNQQAMRSAALAAGLELREGMIFDAAQMVRITEKVLEQAWTEGNCVIVGRGSQCVLQHKRDAYHVFVYAPLKERILRLRTRLAKGTDVEERIRVVDGERAKYLQQYFGKGWCNPHLYDLMISSCEDEDATALVISYGMTGRILEPATRKSGIEPKDRMPLQQTS